MFPQFKYYFLRLVCVALGYIYSLKKTLLFPLYNNTFTYSSIYFIFHLVDQIIHVLSQFASLSLKKICNGTKIERIT